ncbi:MAG TPA: hypothetical protein DIW30_05505 [Bacteroidales bacterium]|nr:hypothetical protein [Bacteroidales bacterium]
MVNCLRILLNVRKEMRAICFDQEKMTRHIPTLIGERIEEDGDHDNTSEQEGFAETENSLYLCGAFTNSVFMRFTFCVP